MRKIVISTMGTVLSLGLLTQTVAAEEPTVTSETAILISKKSGEVLYAKQADKQMYPASITKILTGIMAIEQGDLDEVVTVSEDAVDVIGTTVFLLEDEEMELEQLIQGLLINSGNDAGSAIAEHLAGSEEAFAQEMNEFLEDEIGVTNTHFTNPHGLYNANHYTTAYDMAKITQYALNNETFREIVGTEELDWEGESWETTLYNHHQLVRDHDEITGVKNGFVSQSGFTLVTSAETEDDEWIVVTLNAPSSQAAYSDARSLLSYGTEHFSTNELEAGKVFEDEDGQQYELEQDAYVTFGDRDDLEVTVLGQRLVITEGETVRLVEELSLIEEEKKEAVTGADVEETIDTSEPNFLDRLLRFFHF
ncbi:D-alanyl-D-alanine carboxypeptidase [Bacillus sp. JCM 19046]|nr:D-alanyl-D-alanine carboxypeptidase [Bacillus sp. JCM 19046]